MTSVLGAILDGLAGLLTVVVKVLLSALTVVAVLLAAAVLLPALILAYLAGAVFVAQVLLLALWEET